MDFLVTTGYIQEWGGGELASLFPFSSDTLSLLGRSSFVSMFLAEAVALGHTLAFLAFFVTGWKIACMIKLESSY